MPLYEYQCASCSRIDEVVRSYLDRDQDYLCECGRESERLPSKFYTTPERLYGEWMGHRTILNDSKDDPWEGSSLEGRGGPNKGRYKSKKIQVDLGR